MSTSPTHPRATDPANPAPASADPASASADPAPAPADGDRKRKAVDHAIDVFSDGKKACNERFATIHPGAVVNVGLALDKSLSPVDAAKKTIVYCACLVINQLGRIHIESAYRTALAAELQDQGFTVVEEYPTVMPYTTSSKRVIAAAKPRIDIVAVSPKNVRFIIELKHRNPTPAVEADAVVQAKTYRRTTLSGPFEVAVIYYPKTAAHSHTIAFL